MRVHILSGKYAFYGIIVMVLQFYDVTKHNMCTMYIYEYVIHYRKQSN